MKWLAARALPVLVAFGLATVAASAQTAASDVKIEIVPAVGHSEYVNAVAFAPDGRTVLSGSNDHTLKLWHVASGRLLRSFEGHTDVVQAVAYAPDGKTVLSGSWDHTVKLWDIASGRLLRTFEGHSDSVMTVAYTPDGTSMLSGSSDHTIKRWEIASGKLLLTLPGGRTDGVSAIAVSPDGKTVFDSNLKLWDIASGRVLRTLQGRFDSISTVAFAPDGKSVLVGYSDKAVRILDVASGRVVRTFTGHTSPIHSVAFAPDGKIVASASMDRTVKLWDVASGRTLQTLEGHSEEVHSVAFAPDGRAVLSGSWDHTVRLWDVGTGIVLRTFQGHSDRINAVALAPDGRSVVSGHLDHTLKLWDAVSGRLLHIMEGHADDVRTVAYAPDGKTLLSGSWDRTVKLWDAATGALLRTFTGHTGWVQSVAFSPDGKTALSGGDMGGPTGETLKLWDIASGHLLRTLDKRNAVGAATFSPDGRTVLSGNTDGQMLIRLWDAASGQPVRSFQGNSSEVHGVAFAPDGRSAVSGSWDNAVKLWDVASGRLLRTFNGHTNLVTSVAFAPDGQSVLSGSEDHTLKLWDVASGRMLRTFTGHLGGATSVAFSRDGRFAVSGSADSTVRYWSVATGELLATAIDLQGGEWITITPEGFFDASEHGAQRLSVVRGLELYSVDQFYQSLYRPDLVREKLAGDPRGLVRAAAANLDLDKVLASGNAPGLTLVSPQDNERASSALITAEIAIVDNGGGIGRVEWRVNGVTVGIEIPSAPPAGVRLRLGRGLLLDEGDNDIEVVAYNSRNLIASAPVRATVTGPAPTNRVPPRLFVLAVGINGYADPNLRLNFAVPDAQALADAFAKTGKDLYRDIDVTMLQDGDVTRAGLDRAFVALASKVQPTDVFVFFIAGHGKTVDGRYYFIPQDFHLDGLPSILSGGVPQEQWQDWFSRIPAKRSVLLFDTCESASLTGEGKETRALEQGAASARLVQATGRTIMTAATGDALEGYRGHGLFTYNLIEALGRADSDGDGKITVAELAAYVYAQVTALSDQVFKEHQEPQIRITGTDYSLATTTNLVGSAEPGLVIASKPTHTLSAGIDLLVQPGLGARRVHKLDAQTPVTLVRTDGGWNLVAREGKTLGYVAAGGLAPIR